MENKIIEIESKYENGKNIKSITNNSESSKKQNNEKEIKNGNTTYTMNEFGETNIRENNKSQKLIKLIIIRSRIFLVLVIIINFVFMSSNKDDELIDNNNERNKGVIQLIT